ncbi:hypothetical protein NQ318_012409 [Aromia moschata]|uniref:Uncharacterized protein n=1 Tax=Aromia moschata TaxID=1265417 RepID=A0AAV8Y5H0_9CUCU|nr:hypothetical protein NQ318_012409 [Aromia moschata]
MIGKDNAHYKFEYGVNDPNTQDVKSQQEQRDGHQVMGTYMLREPDGTTRVVRYKSGPNTGFEAVVEKTGQAQHPASYGGSGRSQGSPHSTGYQEIRREPVVPEVPAMWE